MEEGEGEKAEWPERGRERRKERESWSSEAVLLAPLPLSPSLLPVPLLPYYKDVLSTPLTHWRGEEGRKQLELKNISAGKKTWSGKRVEGAEVKKTSGD